MHLANADFPPFLRFLPRLSGHLFIQEPLIDRLFDHSWLSGRPLACSVEIDGMTGDELEVQPSGKDPGPGPHAHAHPPVV